MGVKIFHFFDDATSTFTYLVHDPATLDAIIIDPVWDFDMSDFSLTSKAVNDVITYVKKEKLIVHYILETHVHADHVTSSQILKRTFDSSKIAISKNILTVQKTFKKLLDLDLATDGSQFDRLLNDNEEIVAGSLKIKTISTPGHTPACSCYLIEDNLFTGDSIFMPDFGTGRCDFPGGSAESLFNSITQRIYSLPNNTKIYVGHDYGPGGRSIQHQTSVGIQKEKNIHVSATTSKHEFIKFRTTRDATLAVPKLLYPSIQINVAAGIVPDQKESGLRLLHMPLKVND